MKRWHKNMKYFYIIVNSKRDSQLKLTKEIHQFIIEHGGVCGYQVNQKKEGELFDACQIPQETECILVVGGDGTLLAAARNMAGRNIPLIGVNAGHVGYLCELEADNAIRGVEQLLAEDNYTVEERMLLAGFSMIREKRSAERMALNDIVIHRSGMLQVIDLVIFVNGEYLNTYSADGIIIATPTGSTGYSMSAGGPIVDPKARLILVTPISPHALNAKSIVLGAEEEIMVEVASRSGGEETVEVSFDGEHVGTLHAGDRIIVKRAEPCTGILKLSRLSFLERMRKKLHAYTR